jgi:signal transduction histidine kinase
MSLSALQTTVASFEQFCADCLLHECHVVARSWLERVHTELPPRVRPGVERADPRDLAAGVSERVAGFLCDDEERALAADPLVVERLTCLAAARYADGSEPHVLVREFEQLAQVLDGACLQWLRAYPGTPEADAVLRAAGRLNRAALLLAEVAVGAFRRLEHEAREREADRLRAFVNDLAHEVKVPLGAAETAAHVLDDEELVGEPEQRKRFTRLVQRSLRRGRSVIDDVRALALARAPKGREGRALPIGLVLASVLAESREAIERAGVRIDVLEPVPELLVDAARVEMILLNLLDNAAKYSDPSQSARWVRVGFHRDPSDHAVWWAEVSDNGLGIAEQDQPRVFDRFFRAHPEHAEGSGLGLAIVREAARQLGGQLHVRSAPGVGSTFRFSLRVE